MRAGEFVCLMYHDLELPGGAVSHRNFGHMPYVVRASAFLRQISLLRTEGWKGCKVSEALAGKERAVALTFDDGAISDIRVAAPALSDAGFTATFYIVTSWVHSNGFLTRGDIRSLAANGFDIGSHSATHSFLPGLRLHELRRELCDSKDQLEQWSGKPVVHFACPFGSYTSKVLTVAAEAGYTTVATSKVGLNEPGSAALNRVVVRRSTSLDRFGRICAGKNLLHLRARQLMLSGLKSAMGLPAVSRLASLASATPHVR